MVWSKIFGRLLLVIPTLLGAITLVFLVSHAAPGSPIRSMLGEKADADTVREFNERYGLNQPIHIQYLRFLKRTFIHLDFGDSIEGFAVSDELYSRFTATVELSMAAMLPACILGIGLGVLASLRPGGFIDVASAGMSTLGVSIPVFFLGLLFLLLFRSMPMGERLDLILDIEPITGLFVIDAALRGQWEEFRNALKHLVLPALTLGTIPLAVISRMTRAAMIEVLQSDYIRTARAKGLGSFRVVLRHALPNAAMPILTITGMQFGYLLAGAVLTETIFNWPGLGLFLTEAVLNRDFNVIQASAFLIVLSFVSVNLSVDLAYLWLNPRLREENS